MDSLLFNKRVLIIGAFSLASLSFTAQAQQTWTYTYTADGQIETADGPRTDANDLSTYSYDISGNLSSVANGLSHTTQYTDYDANGRVLQAVDVNGVATDFAYTARGWLKTATLRHPSDSSLDQRTHYTYDAVGQLIGVAFSNVDSIVYEYDGARRLTAVEDAAGNRIEYTLDAAGNRIGEVVNT